MMFLMMKNDVWKHEIGKKSIRKLWVVVRKRSGFWVSKRENDEIKKTKSRRKGLLDGLEWLPSGYPLGCQGPKGLRTIESIYQCRPWSESMNKHFSKKATQQGSERFIEPRSLKK